MRSDPPLRAGFSLVEVLIVIVVIGILAAVAIPKFSGTTAKADLANVKSDLHALVLAPPGEGVMLGERRLVDGDVARLMDEGGREVTGVGRAQLVVWSFERP